MTDKKHEEFVESMTFCELVNSQVRSQKKIWKSQIIRGFRLFRYSRENAQKPSTKATRDRDEYLEKLKISNEKRRIDGLQELAHMSIAQKNLCNKKHRGRPQPDGRSGLIFTLGAIFDD